MEGATVQANVTGTVEGQAKLEVTVTASSYLEAIVKRAEDVVKLAGSLTSNGPGSTGKSSPDAAAPSRGSTGLMTPPPGP
jgi:hypothetical protein